MQKLDQKLLNDITSEYLNEDVSVHIEKGGIGKSGGVCELFVVFLDLTVPSFFVAVSTRSTTAMNTSSQSKANHP